MSIAFECLILSSMSLSPFCAHLVSCYNAFCAVLCNFMVSHVAEVVGIIVGCRFARPRS